MRSSITEIFAAAVLVSILSVAVVAIYVYYDSSTQQARTQKQLDQLTERHEKLQEEYQSVVRKTAVTELEVKDGKLSVLVRQMDGLIDRIPTTYDPAREIYVDYVILDSRLWIRRVFDDQTAPENATVINPQLKTVNWQADKAQYGKAIYRALDEGRWVITVTGNGSLGLVKVDEDSKIDPQLAPELKLDDETQVVGLDRD